MTKITMWIFILFVVISVWACSVNKAPYPNLQNDTVVPVAENNITCAKAGGSYSSVYPDYPKTCCEGLTAWESGMDTQISVADKCIQTDLLSGMPVGTCIACGDGVCGNKENPCNCPQDCTGKNLSEYKSVAEFCTKGKSAYCDHPLAGEWPDLAALCKQC